MTIFKIIYGIVQIVWIILFALEIWTFNRYRKASAELLENHNEVAKALQTNSHNIAFVLYVLWRNGIISSGKLDKDTLNQFKEMKQRDTE